MDKPKDSVPPTVAKTPSTAVKVFTVFGFLVSTGVFAGVCTAVAVVEFDASRKYALFALFWGVSARFLQWSVSAGIRTNAACLRDERILGEQLFAAPVTKWMVNFEIVLSALLLALGVG